MIDLRPHQLKAIAMLRAALAGGARRPMLQLATGAGKTRIAAAIIELTRRRATMDEKMSFYGQLLFLARERGYKAGWAARQYRERFGTWPPNGRYPRPQPPTASTRAWVKSRLIAHAKALEAACARERARRASGCAA